MKTKKQKETNEKEIPLLEQKGYERMVNEIVPVQQVEAYRKPTQKAVKEAVKELNPDTNSLGSRGWLFISFLSRKNSFLTEEASVGFKPTRCSF